MRRKYFGLALAALATLGPAQAFGGDREIAQEIIGRLKASRDAGELKDFTLDMKVDNGVVKFRGNVNNPDQQTVVLAATEGVEGILDVVNELTIRKDAQAAAPEATLVKPKRAAVSVAKAEPIDEADSQDFAAALAEEDFSEGLANSDVAEQATPVVIEQVATTEANDAQAEVVDPAFAEPVYTQEVVPGVVLPTANYESRPAEKWAAEAPAQTAGVSDEQLSQSVVRALGKAKDAGHLKGFAVDVQASNGILDLTGKCSSAEQRDLMIRIAQMAPGAQGVKDQLRIAAPVAAPRSSSVPARTVSNRTPSLPALPVGQPSQLQPMPMAAPQPARAPMMGRPTPAQAVSYGDQYINGEQVVPGSMVTNGGGYGGPVSSAPSGPVMGSPMPMAQAAAVGAPRYDSPNLPNYAWPGYAAYPNYAALSYPQQYSPSAFPYIGPFYPYPQVPLGWRKVSLEWDDGWWFLDFTDK